MLPAQSNNNLVSRPLQASTEQRKLLHDLLHTTFVGLLPGGKKNMSGSFVKTVDIAIFHYIFVSIWHKSEVFVKSIPKSNKIRYHVTILLVKSLPYDWYSGKHLEVTDIKCTWTIKLSKVQVHNMDMDNYLDLIFSISLITEICFSFSFLINKFNKVLIWPQCSIQLVMKN